jgi:hypothetical protein
MFGSLMGSLIDSEGIVTGKIQQTLSDLSEELNEPDHRNFFITIKPLDSEDFEFECEVFHRGTTGFNRVREITIKEIVDK